jgi:hypothetical protein
MVRWVSEVIFMTDTEKIERLTAMGYKVSGTGIRPAKGGTKVFTINCQAVDELFVLQLLDGWSWHDVMVHQNEWLNSN